MNNLIIRLLEDKIESYSNLAKKEYEYYQDYNDESIRRQLISILKTRSEYKRALKEYRQLYHSMEMKKYQKALKEYKTRPDKYIEKMLGVKLFPYQKLILKMFYNK